MVGGGVSTFYTVEGNAAAFQAALTTFYTSMKLLCPTGGSFTVPTAGEKIDDNTGELAGTWAAGTGGVINCTNSTEYAAGVGARIVWETAGTRGGRRVRGSTFIVPLGSNQWQNDGTLSPTCVGAIQTAANILLGSVAAEDMVILSRVTPAHLSGTSSGVLSARAVDKVSWLRGRRT